VASEAVSAGTSEAQVAVVMPMTIDSKWKLAPRNYLTLYLK